MKHVAYCFIVSIILSLGAINTLSAKPGALKTDNNIYANNQASEKPTILKKHKSCKASQEARCQRRGKICACSNIWWNNKYNCGCRYPS